MHRATESKEDKPEEGTTTQGLVAELACCTPPTHTLGAQQLLRVVTEAGVSESLWSRTFAAGNRVSFSTCRDVCRCC